MSAPRLSEVSEMYIQARTSEGLAPNTMRLIQHTLTRFQRSAGDLLITSIGPAHVDEFFATYADRWSAGTRACAHSLLKTFFNWCKLRGIIKSDRDPMQGRRSPKQPKRQEKRKVPPAQFPALLDAAASYDERDRIVVAMLMYLLCRQSELTTVRIRDVDLQSGYIRLTIHKTSDMDHMPISSELDAALRRWLTHYSKLAHANLDPDWYLIPKYKRVPPTFDPVTGRFTAYTGQLPVDPTKPAPRLEDAVKRALDKIGFSTRLDNGRSAHEGCHTLRRSAAWAMYQEERARGNSQAIRRVQAWLHHSTVAMTEYYIGLVNERAERDEQSKGKPLFPSLTKIATISDVERRASGQESGPLLRPSRL